MISALCAQALHQALLLQQQNQQQAASNEATMKSEHDDADMQATQNGDSEHAAGNGDQNAEAESAPQASVVTKSHIDAICADVSAHWKDLAKNLRFVDDDIQYLESETTDTVAQARKMLTLWMVSGNIVFSLHMKAAVLMAHCQIIFHKEII